MQEMCEWFWMCKSLATGMTPHPLLGSVPTCDKCHAFATGFPREHVRLQEPATAGEG